MYMATIQVIKYSMSLFYYFFSEIRFANLTASHCSILSEKRNIFFKYSKEEWLYVIDSW